MEQVGRVWWDVQVHACMLVGSLAGHPELEAHHGLMHVEELTLL
jgi:hypothetical protein